MARMKKYSTGIVGEIKHNIREFKNGTCETNAEVNPEKTKENYFIIRRGDTAKDIEKYRKKIEKECFHYNRKNLVHANEVICTLPADCPPDQERKFFEESFKYICSTLPMGERCVFLAEVHCDEGHVLKDGVTVAEGAKHLHVMYVPAVPDSKHEGFKYKLCSDDLTKRAILKQWHPNYQKWMDEAGVKCTVASGVTSGKGISVKSLKEISKQTGLSLQQIQNLEKENKLLHSKLIEIENELAASHHSLTQKDILLSELRTFAESSTKEISKLHSQLHDKIVENQQIKSLANEKIASVESELQKAQERIKELEEKQRTISQEHSSKDWGTQTWGTDNAWGTGTQKTLEEEKLW